MSHDNRARHQNNNKEKGQLNQPQLSTAHTSRDTQNVHRYEGQSESTLQMLRDDYKINADPNRARVSNNEEAKSREKPERRRQLTNTSLGEAQKPGLTWRIPIESWTYPLTVRLLNTDGKINQHQFKRDEVLPKTYFDKSGHDSIYQVLARLLEEVHEIKFCVKQGPNDISINGAAALCFNMMDKGGVKVNPANITVEEVTSTYGVPLPGSMAAEMQKALKKCALELEQQRETERRRENERQKMLQRQIDLENRREARKQGWYTTGWYPD